MNEEIGRLKNEVHILTESQENVKNGAFLSKLQRVLGKLESFSSSPITEEVVKDVFYIQDLVEEVKK